jgi:hypothetical protein
MFLEHYGDIKPFFSMVSFFDDKKEMWDVSNNNNTRVSLDRYHVTNWLDPQKTIPIELLQKWETYNDIMWTLVPIKYNTPNVRIKEILSSVEYNPLTFMSSYKLINGKIKNNIINKCEIVLREGKYTKLLTLLNPYFCDCDFSSTHINDVEGFVSKYSQLLNIIVKFKINLQECVELIKVIKRVISVEGDWIEIKLMEILGNWNVVIL